MGRAVELRTPSHVPMVLTLGVACQIGQVVYLRELLMVFHGNELSLGVILAAWMVWVAVGSRLGAALLQRRDDALGWLRSGAAAVALLLPATVLAIRLLPGAFDVPPGALLSLADMALSSVVVLAPTTALLGAQFVFLARLWRERDQSVDASGAAKTYVGEALGNVVGGLLFTLVLVHHLDAFQASLLAGTAMLVLTLRLGQPRRALLAAGVGLALLTLLPQVEWWSAQLQWQLRAPDYELITTHRSRYGTIAVLRRFDQYSFFQSGHLVFSTGGVTETGVGLEELEGVAFAHVALTQHRDPRQVLLIGGGLRGTLREMLRHGVRAIDYVELDPVLVEAASPYLPAGTRAALADPRVRLIHADGRLLVKGGGPPYDLIVVDAPDPTTAVLNRYYTEEFFAEAKARLRPDGVLVLGAMSTPDLRGSAVANRNAAIYHTLRRVFPEVLPVGERYLFFFASKGEGQLSADAATVMRRFVEREVDAAGFSAGHLALLFEPGPLQRINWILRHHGRSPRAHLEPPMAAPLLPGTIEQLRVEEALLPPVHERFFVNSDFRPVVYYHTLLFWTGLTRGDEASVLRWIGRVQWWWVLPPLVLTILVGLALRIAVPTRRDAAPRFAVLTAVFTTGLSTMALQIALLFAFQSIYGFVFEMVGLIVAIFMAGLALGSALTHRFVPDPADRRLLTAVQGLVALVAVGIGGALPWAGGLEGAAEVFVLFASLTFVAGLLNGVDFPLATACYLALERRPERATAAVYGVELVGACCGAALASVAVAPVLGIVACCLLAAFANGTAFIVLLVGGARPLPESVVPVGGYV